MTVLTVDVDGTNVVIDSDLMKGWNDEAHGYLRKIEIEQENFKLLVETVSETTKLEKKYVSKYLKARFSAKTKESRKYADLFEVLDEAAGD